MRQPWTPSASIDIIHHNNTYQTKGYSFVDGFLKHIWKDDLGKLQPPKAQVSLSNSLTFIAK